MVPILILAAGASARMGGRDKLLKRVGGEALLRRTAREALSCGAPVFCTLPPDRPLRRAELADLALRIVEVADAAAGMSASLRAGIAALPEAAQGVMILPADMPLLTGQDLSRCLQSFDAEPSQILRATAADGTPGHPAVFPSDLFAELAAIAGDEGGRSVLARHPDRVRTIALPARHAVLDLDTPDDWAAFRARGPG